MALKSDKYNQSKQLLPTNLRSEEMSFLDRQLRERAFWSAGVDNARVLSEIHSSIGEVINGNFSETEARVEINKILAKHNYNPTAGTEGGIKDLRTYARQRVIIKTNVEMARGYAQLEDAQETLDEFPCYELVRGRRAKEPRDWIKTWEAKGGKFYGKSKNRMIAEVNDPIWIKISKFGNPYPPFDFNSGMVLKSIGRNLAVQLGVIKKDFKPQERRVIPSINENLEAKLNAPEELWEKVEKSFEGFAVRDGDKLIFTDPNGTKPYSSKDIVGVIGANLPNIYKNSKKKKYVYKSGNIQKEAFEKWVKDSHAQRYNPNLDITEDVGRLFERIESMKGNIPIFRGLSFSSKEDPNYKSLMAQINNGVFQSEAFNSFSTDESVAEDFAIRNSFQVVLEVKKHSSVKDLQYLVEEINPAYKQEKEVMLLYKKNYRIINKKQTTASNGLPLLKIELEEINE